MLPPKKQTIPETNPSIENEGYLYQPVGEHLGAPAKTNAFRKGNGRMLSSPTEDKDKPKRKREEQAPPLPRVEGKPKKIPKPVGRWLAAAVKAIDSRNHSVYRKQRLSLLTGRGAPCCRRKNKRKPKPFRPSKSTAIFTNR